MAKHPENHPLNLIDQHLAACIRVRRELCGLSASNLDRAASLAPGSVSRLERNEKRLKPDVLIVLAKALGIDVDDFFQGAPSIKDWEEAMPHHDISNAEVESLVAAFSRISNPEVRREFAALVNSVGKSSLFGAKVHGQSPRIKRTKRSAS